MRKPRPLNSRGRQRCNGGGDEVERGWFVHSLERRQSGYENRQR